MSDNNRNLSSNNCRKLRVVIKELTHHLNEEHKYNRRNYPSLTSPLEGIQYINSFASIYSTLEERRLQEAIIEYDYLEDDDHNKYTNAWLNLYNIYPTLQDNDADAYTDAWIEAGGGIGHINVQHHLVDTSVQTLDNPVVNRTEIVASSPVAPADYTEVDPPVAHTDDAAKVKPAAPHPDNAQGDTPNLAGPSVPHNDDSRSNTDILASHSIVHTDNTHGDTGIPANPKQDSTTQTTVALLPFEVAKNVGWNTEGRLTIDNWWIGTTTNLPTTTSKDDNTGCRTEKGLADTSNNNNWNTDSSSLDTGDEGTGWRDSNWGTFNDNTMGRSSTEKDLAVAGGDNVNWNAGSPLVDTGNDTNWNTTENKLVDTDDATENDNKWLPLTNTASWKKHFIEPQEEQEEQDLINFNANDTTDTETQDAAHEHPGVQTLIDSSTTFNSYHTAPESFIDAAAEGSHATVSGGNTEAGWVPTVDCSHCIKYTRSELFNILYSMPSPNTKLGIVAGRLLNIYLIVKTDTYDANLTKEDAENGGVDNLVDRVMQLSICCPSRQPKGPPNKESVGFSPGLPHHEGTQKYCISCKTMHT